MQVFGFWVLINRNFRMKNAFISISRDPESLRFQYKIQIKQRKYVQIRGEPQACQILRGGGGFVTCVKQKFVDQKNGLN